MSKSSNRYPQHGLNAAQRLADVKGIRDALKRFDVARLPEDGDLVSQSLTRYLVIRSAGYIESIRDDLADEYVLCTSNERVHRYVTGQLRSGMGAAPVQLVTFVSSFDKSWGEDLRGFLDANDGELAGDLGALVAARKKIAHGAGDQVTESKAIRYADSAIRIGKKLEQLFRSPK